MGPTWNPARRQKTGLWENGEGAGVGTGVVFQKMCSSGHCICKCAAHLWENTSLQHLWTGGLPYDQLQTDGLCLWSLKSVNVFPRPLGTWMSLQAKSHGVGRIQGMTLDKVKSSLLYMSFKLQFQSLWDFS